MKTGFQTSGLFDFARISHLWRQHVLTALWVVMTAVLPIACSDDVEQPVPQANGHTAVIYLNFKTGASKQAAEMNASQSSETRAPLTRAIDENGINTVDVLSFKVDPADPTNIKKGTFFYRAQGEYDAATQSVRVYLVSDAAAQTLVVLANVREQVDALTPAFDEQKEAVMNRLLLPVTADGTPDFTNGMPMWGELPTQTVNESYGQTLAGAPTVTMIRSVVKFTYKEKTSLLLAPNGNNLWYNGLHFEAYNFRSKGRIAPDNFQSASFSVTTPTVPMGATQAQGINHTLAEYVPLTYNGTGGEVSFYMFESDNSKANTSALDATCLVVNFLGGPADGWHRLDFRDYNQPAGTGFMDLLRGYHYVIEPEEWDGTLGAVTAEEAFKGISKIKCRIVPWNEVQEEVIVRGNKRLTVNKRVFAFDGDIQIGVASLPVNITTENTNWQITGKPSWISLSQTSGTAGVPATVTISANSKNFTQNTRSAVLSIRTGNSANELEYRLHVSQQPACGFGNSMKLMRIGGSNYQTTRMGNGGVCWMIDASREGGPNMAARPRTYPFTAATVGPIYYGSIPYRACPDGWRLPTAWEVINLIQSTTNHYPAVFARLTESGVGVASGMPGSSSLPLSAPTASYEATLAIWTQTPMIYSSPQRHSPVSVLHTGIFWEWKPGSYTETVSRYKNRNIWALVYAAGNDIHSPAGLPAGFNEYAGIHYLNGGSVRCVHDQ